MTKLLKNARQITIENSPLKQLERESIFTIPPGRELVHLSQKLQFRTTPNTRNI